MRRMKILLGLLCAATLAGCGKDTPPDAGDTPTADTPEKSLRIAVCPKGTVHEFWQTVKAGADAAAEEIGGEVLWKGPAQETMVAEQITILEDFIASKVDAIVMAACDAKALVDVAEKATDAGIPVVTIDSGLAEEEDVSVSFVATDNVAGARQAATELARLIGGKGEVGLIPFIQGAATSDWREQGFVEGLKDHPDIKLVKTLYSDSDVGKGMNATEDMLTAHPNLAGIFAANEPGAMGCAQALEARGLGGKVKVVAFDASPGQIEALEQGTVQALIVQNPYRMGYEGVMQAKKALDGEECEKRVDTGVTVVTKENVSDPEVEKILYPLGKPSG